jgi:hypothetical protein
VAILLQGTDDFKICYGGGGGVEAHFFFVIIKKIVVKNLGANILVVCGFRENVTLVRGVLCDLK